MRTPRLARKRASVLLVFATALTACGTSGSSESASTNGLVQVVTTAASTTTTNPHPDGPFAVGRRVETFVDPSRATPANGTVPGQASRTLETIIEYPAQGAPSSVNEVEGAPPAPGKFPVVIYVHGFGAHADDPYLHPLAAAGYVALAIKFPLTNHDAPGGPDVADLVSEPADVSFVISQLARLPDGDADLRATVDPTEIGLIGGSAGALVAHLLTYDPALRDGRIKAVIEQSCSCGHAAWPVDVRVPVMLMHGTADPVIPYESSSSGFSAAPSPKYFLTLTGAKHIQYDEPWLSVSARVSIDFFDAYLKQKGGALTQLRTDAEAQGISTLQEG